LTFEVGEFLYTSTDQKVKFPRFEATGKPYLWKQKLEPVKAKKGFFRRLFEAVTFSETTEPLKPDETDEESEDLDLDQEFNDPEMW
jgi:hypothetical protein